MLNHLFPRQTLKTLALTVLALSALLSTPLAARAQVAPANAKPHGYSLNDMARALALFDTSGNDPNYLPDVPFQILSLDPSTINVTNLMDGGQLITAGNSFAVDTGDMFYVPINWEDDSPPVIGAWPTDARSARSYFFGPTQLGFIDGSVTIDNGNPISIGEDYLAGPVQVPFLLDGPGTHLLQLGFFMNPLRPGKHTLVLQGRLTGAAFRAATGLAYQAFKGVYTVTVTNHSH